MKVLTSPNGTILTFPMSGGDFRGFDSKTYATGIVAEASEARIKMLAAAALPKPNSDGAVALTGSDNLFHWTDVREIMRDIRWIGKRLVDTPVGTTGITLEYKGRGVGLAIPAGAEPVKAEPKIGDVIAVNSNITPKALMNARGIVTAVNGTRITATLTKGDLKRIERATGKKFSAEVRLPKASVEVDDECIVEVAA